MRRTPRRRVGLAGALLVLAVAIGPVSARAADPSDLWNPFDHKRNDQCVSISGGAAPMRFADFSEVGSNYIIHSSPVSEGCENTPSRPVSLDAEELITIGSDVKHYVYFHKGDRTSHYGHIGRSEITSPWPTPLSYGPPSNGVGGAGRGCTPAADATAYRIKIDSTPEVDAIPETWQYKIHEPGSRYYKYSSAGDRLTGQNQTKYGYLSWTWVIRHDWPSGEPAPQPPYHNPYVQPDEWGNDRVSNDSGGVVRSLIRDGQTFYRCPVAAVEGLAWVQDNADPCVPSDTDPCISRIVGRVTAVYGKTRTSSAGPWLYGWAIYSHQYKVDKAADGEPLFGPRFYHMVAP